MSVPRLHAWRSTLLLVAAVTLVRLAYLAWGCPYGLVEDEAYYWLWSRHLDWSYLTKGPGVALSIAAGTSVAGDTELGVRLTSPLWGAFLAIGIGGLAGELARQGRAVPGVVVRARFWGAALALLSPALQVSAILMTIDGPMLACWAVALWQGVAALGGPAGRDNLRGLMVAGASISIGILFKPTIAMLIPVLGAALAMQARGGAPRGASQPAPWGTLATFVAVSLLGLVPIVAWNAAHGWPLAEHLAEHVWQEEAPSLGRRTAWIGEYLAVQAALAGVGVVGMGVAIARWRGGTGGGGEGGFGRAPARLILLSSGVVYGLYLVVSGFTRVEGNWALGGLLPALGATAAWMAASPARARHVRRVALVVGLITGVGMLRLDVVARVPGVGGLIPIGRLMGGPALAERTGAILTDLESRTNTSGFVVTDHYGRAALLEFYLNAHRPAIASDGRPARAVRIACASSALGGRLTQFDLWAGSTVLDPDLSGRPAVLLGSRRESWLALFGEVEEREPIPEDHKQRGVFIGFAYRAPGRR